MTDQTSHSPQAGRSEPRALTDEMLSVLVSLGQPEAPCQVMSGYKRVLIQRSELYNVARTGTWSAFRARICDQFWKLQAACVSRINMVAMWSRLLSPTSCFNSGAGLSDLCQPTSALALKVSQRKTAVQELTSNTATLSHCF